MYNIIQLNDKNLSELQTIAQELGIKKTDSLKKEELVYKILDEQAIAGATKKVAADKLKEERKGEKQKRSRVTVKTVKKEGASTVLGCSFAAGASSVLALVRSPFLLAENTLSAPSFFTVFTVTRERFCFSPLRKPGRPRR